MPRSAAAARTSSSARWSLAAAALIFALVVLGDLAPVLIGGKILSPVADLYGTAPFQPYAPRDFAAYLNGALYDVPAAHYPWRVLVHKLLHEGVLPAWNPYALSGVPLYANPQTGLFSLFNLPLWLFSVNYGLGVAAALKLFAGALGTYLLVRQLRLGFLAGILAGVAFAFSSLNVGWLAWDTLPGVAVMLPWACWLVERIFDRRRVGDAIALAIVVAIGLGGGHPGTQVHLIAATGAYALLRVAWTARDSGPGEPAARMRALALVGAGVGAGVLLMAFMLIPEVRSAHGTVGVAARRAGKLGGRMPLQALQTVVFPDRWGRPSAYEPGPYVFAGNDPSAFLSYTERTVYAGVVALLLAGVALVSRARWRSKAPFALLGGVALGVVFNVPGLWWLGARLPILDSVQAQRLHFVFEFAVAVLAAFGLQALLDAPRRDLLRLVVPAVALAGGWYALHHVGASRADVRSTVHHFLTGADSESNGVLALTSIVWFMLFALGVGLAVVLTLGLPRWRAGVAAALVALAVVDALHFAHGYVPAAPAARAVPPVTPAIAYLQRHREDGRVVGAGGALLSEWDLVYGLHDVRGYETPQPTWRMYDLWRLVNHAQVSWAPFSTADLEPRAVRVLSALAVRYVMFAPTDPVVRRMPGRRVYSGRDAIIVANPDAAPWALVPSRIVATSGELDERRRIAESGFDPRTDATVDRRQPGVAALVRQAKAAHGSVTIRRRRNASVTLDVRLTQRGLVALNDQLFDGWSVRIDGRPARALLADDVMRGVIVPAGRHRIVWSYAVPGLRLGVLVSLVTLIALIGGGTALRIRRRRRELAILR